MFEGLDLRDAVLLASIRSPERVQIHEMFRKVRADIEAECTATRQMMRSRIRRLRSLLEQEYANLLQQASPELQEELASEELEPEVEKEDIQPPPPMSVFHPPHEVMFGCDMLPSDGSDLDDYL
jgi:hypothetical protein